MKKIILFVIVLLFASLVYSETIEIKIPSFDKSGNIIEEVYTREMPNDYNDAITVIRALVNSYNETSNAYKEELIKNQNTLNKLNVDLNNAYEKIVLLEELTNSKDKVDKAKENLNKKFNLNTLFGGFGVIGEYGTLNNSNEVALLLGVRIWKFELGLGPNLLIPNNDIVKFGFRGSLGFWF